MFTISIVIAPSGHALTHAGAAPVSKAAVAHVALAHHAALGVVLRHAVGAVPGAVLAADAGVGAVADDAGRRVFGVGVHRAAREAGGLQAVVAAHRQVGARGLRKEAAFDLADPPPVDRRRVAVLLVARHHAALAADALAHVEVESGTARLRPGAGRGGAKGRRWSCRCGRQACRCGASARTRRRRRPRESATVTPSSPPGHEVPYATSLAGLRSARQGALTLMPPSIGRPGAVRSLAATRSESAPDSVSDG